MRLLSFLNTTIGLILVGAGFVQAGELDKIDRPLVKEPAYQSKAPKYALLVLGPEARTRIWLVLDGTTLYLDRNGNGDLTEAGEKVSCTKGSQAILEEDVYTFAVGELRDGDRRHRNVTLIVTGLRSASETKTAASSNSRSLSFRIRMEAEIPGFEGVTKDGRVLQMAGPNDGSLQFADRPREAPILHFAGPLTVVVSGQPTFRVNREMELYLELGTPGRGQGTTVYTAYKGVVPPAAYPRAEIAFPAQKPGGPPVKVIYELKGRC
ncbi:MAG: hypothetical protein ACYC3I_00940 [Gemmataceae bacterium]